MPGETEHQNVRLMIRNESSQRTRLCEFRCTLARALGASYRRLPNDLTRTGDRILRALDLGTGPAEDWAGRFSDVTLMYPALHAELFDLGEVNFEAVGLAHAWLIMNAFAEDRLRDGQITDRGPEISFASACLAEGLLYLESAGVLTDATRDGVRATMRRYYETVDESYLGNGSDDLHDLTADRVIQIASGRAAFGWIATEAMLTSAGLGSELRAELAHAYDLTFTGMQWVDDISDWHEDVTTGDDNLLLVGLAHGFGLNAYALPANEVRSANIAHALLSNGLFAWAEEHAVNCFTRARDIFAQHGLTDLEHLLQKRIEAASKVCEQEQSLCAEVVDTALKLFQGDARRT